MYTVRQILHLKTIFHTTWEERTNNDSCNLHTIKKNHNAQFIYIQGQVSKKIDCRKNRQ